MHPIIATRDVRLSAWSIAIAVFWVVFLWGFWDRGPFALGINAAVFLALFLFGLLGGVFPADRPLWSRRHWTWLVPFIAIIAGYALYSTSVLKAVNIPVAPVLFVIFMTYALLGDRAVHWGWEFFRVTAARGFAWLGSLKGAVRAYSASIFGTRSANPPIRRVIVGAALFLVIVITIILPLLSSADPQFESLARPLLDFLGRLVDVETVWRVVVGAAIALLSLSLGLAWRARVHVPESAPRSRVDAIVSGIVVGGIVVVYALFLGIQLKRLWVSELPLDFSETEILVKSGFWQLFALSVINGVIFLATYAKTNPLVQRLLAAFTIASLLLVFSAAWRMALYVTFYGLSYEKFFASYTVLFSLVLFGWLVFQFFGAKCRDLVKFAAFLFLWMYAALAVFPIEQFILRANMSLAQRPDSRIVLYEATMLSTDVLGYVEARREDPRFEGWDEWIEKNQDQLAKKAWYELTVSDITYRASK